MRRAAAVGVLLAAVAALAALRSSAGNGFAYEDFPAQFHLPTAASTINGAVARSDQRAERAHAWTIWAAMTSPSHALDQGKRLPVWATWTKCVAVDGTGRLVGKTMRVDCNGTTVTAPVVGLDRFYAVRLSDQADVAAANGVFQSSPDHLPPGDAHADIGDYLVLTGIHVTTKEIENWTWQTFWWTPFPHAAPFGSDRPVSV